MTNREDGDGTRPGRKPLFHDAVARVEQSFLVLDLLDRDDIGNQPHCSVRMISRHAHRIANARRVDQDRFHLRRFDSVAGNFHLAVTAA